MTARSGTQLANLLVLSGCVAIAVGLGALYLQSPALVTLEPTEWTVGEVQPGKSSFTTVSFENPGNRLLHVVGANQGCTEHGCGFVQEPLPITLPARDSRKLSLEYKPQRTGPFTYQFVFATDSPASPWLKLTVRGNAVRQIAKPTAEKPGD